MSSIPIRTCLINSDLKSTTKAILGALLSYCHNNKDCCWPSVRDISQVWGYAESTIRKHIRILEKLKFIETTKGNKSRKSNNYKFLKLNSVQKDPNATRRESSKPEGLLKEHNTYGATGGRFDKKNPHKPLILCDLDQSNPEDQSQNKAAIAPVVVVQTEEAIAPAVVAQTEEPIAPVVVAQTEEPIAPVVVAQTETAIAPAVVAKSQNKASVRFEGPLTTRKIVEIYNLYTRQGWIRRCCDSFFTFVANCSMAKRLRKRNVYGHLTWVYKNKLDRKLITAKDEELARKEIKCIQNNGLMPDLMEPQPLLRLDQSPAPQASAPPPPPARTGSRPAMDWPDRNFPETEKELFLQKYVRGRRVTHVHPKWMDKLNCWIVKCRMVDGKMQYETHPLTEDGWYEVCPYSEIVRLLNEQGVRISQADFIQGLIDANSVLP